MGVCILDVSTLAFGCDQSELIQRLRGVTQFLVQYQSIKLCDGTMVLYLVDSHGALYLVVYACAHRNK